MTPLTDAEFQLLTRQVYRDLLVDTTGNLLLGLGLWLAFSRHAQDMPLWMQSPELKAALIATGILNLRFLMARLRRLRLWQSERQSRQKP
ncbi:MAG: hypothetical protein Q7T36_09930 [Fluviicoccus sp.]|uniref:hypothetical protein n=1 Tax=Fluviicoccus sp. TaxID=2003552 RepID=UPI0027292BC4|nr:hypothetical protein [Fluviicoccus sp.]MDO8330774.1 hypothetical protein [Fluviicoccus sp.]